MSLLERDQSARSARNKIMIRKEPLLTLLQVLNESDECEDLEAKHISGDGVGKSTYETICALSNEPDLHGGTILLGVKREQALFPIYEAVGVTNPDKISADIATACATIFNHPIRVDITPRKIADSIVLQIDVPELPSTQRPLYMRAQGLPKGAFRRVGPTDTRCTDEDLQAFF
jgi:ATP-dependent DNA helicase RecG